MKPVAKWKLDQILLKKLNARFYDKLGELLKLAADYRAAAGKVDENPRFMNRRVASLLRAAAIMTESP